jgi:hypothetical protein
MHLLTFDICYQSPITFMYYRRIAWIDALKNMPTIRRERNDGPMILDLLNFIMEGE